MASLTLGENTLFEYAKPINFVQVLGDKAPLFREEAPYVIHNRLYFIVQRKIIMKITRTVGKIKLKHSKSITFIPRTPLSEQRNVCYFYNQVSGSPDNPGVHGGVPHFNLKSAVETTSGEEA